MFEFGNRLRQLRIAHNLSQSQLAAKLNVSKSLISAYENDLRMPSYDVLIAMASIFSVTTDYLLKGSSGNSEIDMSGISPEVRKALSQLITSLKNPFPPDDCLLKNITDE